MSNTELIVMKKKFDNHFFCKVFVPETKRILFEVITCKIYNDSKYLLRLTFMKKMFRDTYNAHI